METNQAVTYNSFRQAYVAFKNSLDPGHADPVTRVLLDIFDEEAEEFLQQEAESIKVDASTVSHEAKRAKERKT